MDMPDQGDLKIRAARNADAEALIRLVGDCFHEYEGVLLDLDDIDRDLLSFETYIRQSLGEAFVVTDSGEVVASVAFVPVGEGRFELKRLYVKAELRGSGLALALLQLVENRVKNQGGESIIAWSDSRFERAHRFYEREGYKRQAKTRDLNDISQTTEYAFLKHIQA